MDYDKCDKIFIQDLTFRCIIGINPEERINKQDVIISLEIYTDFSVSEKTENIEDTVNYKELKLALMDMVEGSSFLLAERLAAAIADLCLEFKGVRAVKVRLEKPGALRFARTVGVEIFRPRKEE